MKVRAGGRRGLDLGKQKLWTVFSSVRSSLEPAGAAGPVTNAGRSRACSSLALEQGARTALWAEVPRSGTPEINK